MWNDITEEEKNILKLMLKSSADFYKFFINTLTSTAEEGEDFDVVLDEFVETDAEQKVIRFLMTTDMIEKIKKI